MCSAWDTRPRSSLSICLGDSTWTDEHLCFTARIRIACSDTNRLLEIDLMGLPQAVEAALISYHVTPRLEPADPRIMLDSDANMLWLRLHDGKVHRTWESRGVVKLEMSLGRIILGSIQLTQPAADVL